jgi:hypothetical protein
VLVHSEVPCDTGQGPLHARKGCMMVAVELAKQIQNIYRLAVSRSSLILRYCSQEHLLINCSLLMFHAEGYTLRCERSRDSMVPRQHMLKLHPEKKGNLEIQCHTLRIVRDRMASYMVEFCPIAGIDSCISQHMGRGTICQQAPARIQKMLSSFRFVLVYADVYKDGTASPRRVHQNGSDCVHGVTG